MNNADHPAPNTSRPSPQVDVERVSAEQLNRGWRGLLKPLASLKLTVACFLAAIVIVLVGTLAQVNDDIWKVVDDYFRVDFRQLLTNTFPYLHLDQLFVWVKLSLFFPPAFFPPAYFGENGLNLPSYAGFWFPKGWTIGAVMFVNLMAAHAVRFKVQAKGKRLYIGWGIIALGALVTFAVIVSGSTADGLQTDPVVSYQTFWWLIESTLFGLCAISVYAAITADRQHPERRWIYGGLAVALALTSYLATLFDGGDQSAMRILYQLMQATFAGLMLLAGCLAVFKKRGGIVLMHAGIGLMMAYDVLVGVEHVESQMHIQEGQTVWFSRDMREAELAIVDSSDSKNSKVTVIDARRLNRAGDEISDPRLPFKIKVLSYYPNSNLLGPRQPVPEGVPAENPATEGTGKQVRAVPVAGSTGTDTASRFDVPSAYLQLISPEGKDLGTYLASAHFDLNLNDTADPVVVDGKTYDVSLRFKRLYNPYSVTLNDIKKVDYQGTDQPKDYSSYITLEDPEKSSKFDYRIWMNNPMRYAGRTFYQSGYNRLDSGEMTTLQVVDNAGWMTPYVACMMVVVGMVYHFGQTLLRFLHRRMRETTGTALMTDSSDETVTVTHQEKSRKIQKISWGVTAAVLLLALYNIFQVVRPIHEKPDQFHLAEFGELPIWYKGRPMPMDTFARNTLLQLSDYQTYKDEEGKRHPAIEWLIALMADTDKGREIRVIRIENDEVRNLVGLETRPGFTYSFAELSEKLPKLFEQAQLFSQTPAKNRSLLQRKTINLANQIVLYLFLERTLGEAPPLPKSEPAENLNPTMKLAARAQQYFEYLKGTRSAVEEFSKQYGLGPQPLVVPTHLGTEGQNRPNIDELQTKWEPLTIAHIYQQFYGEFPAPTPAAIEKFLAILDDYKAGNVEKFNADLKDYQAFLKSHESAEDLPVKKVEFESWFTRISPFDLCATWYVVAGILAAIGWLGYPQVFQRSAFWLLVLILILHTLALVGRIYISGRPPVTNLYSSAVFIGWAVVLGALIMEWMTRLGIGNVAAAIVGFLTLRIAAGLAADGDTFVVLEAVLDTQFWLATHVVCISLGYATTYLAGTFGLLYILRGVFMRDLTPEISKELIRMTYGTLCFATFFSFWGTVLGGLWADDSWGRFWGWDPKENGALIIVLWNALVLHARWGKMVGDRGMAILVVLGNIVVSWSWFGVNELGVGLHSYGFTEGRLKMLGLFVISQLIVALIGLLPQRYWRSYSHVTVKE